jgi:hypothetical protein
VKIQTPVNHELVATLVKDSHNGKERMSLTDHIFADQAAVLASQNGVMREGCMEYKTKKIKGLIRFFGGLD